MERSHFTPQAFGKLPERQYIRNKIYIVLKEIIPDLSWHNLERSSNKSSSFANSTRIKCHLVLRQQNLHINSITQQYSVQNSKLVNLKRGEKPIKRHKLRNDEHVGFCRHRLKSTVYNYA